MAVDGRFSLACLRSVARPHAPSRTLGIYEKDRAVPVDPRKVPSFDDDQLSEMPAGYRK